MNYDLRLLATKQYYPFAKWLTYSEGDDPLEQYTRENCAQAAKIFDDLIESLTELGEAADDDEKIALFELEPLRIGRRLKPQQCLKTTFVA